MRNPEVPHIVDLVVAKALAKNAEDRYQSAKELIEDLRECRSVVQGFATTQPLVRSPGNALPLAPSATRREDKVLAIRTSGAKPAQVEPEKPGLAVSKAFDSYEATMRLAAMTGVEKELGEPPRPQPAAPAVKAAGNPAVQKVPEPNVTSSSKRRGGKSQFWMWAVSILAITTAAVLVWLSQQ